MRKVEALLKILLNLVDHIFNFIPVIDLCRSAFALLALTDQSTFLLFLIIEGYQTDFLEGVDSSSCGISAWLLIRWQITYFVALDSDDKVIEAVDRKDA